MFLLGSTGKMMQVINTNCMTALRSSSPSRLAKPCSSGLNCKSTATPPPTAIAAFISAAPNVNRAPTANINSMATSVVVPIIGCIPGSPARWPFQITATMPSRPAATVQPPSRAASSAETVPSTVIRGKVLMPAVPEAACSRCSPTKSPSSRESPNCRNIGSMRITHKTRRNCSTHTVPPGNSRRNGRTCGNHPLVLELQR